jgi:hypothetical protein
MIFLTISLSLCILALLLMLRSASERVAKLCEAVNAIDKAFAEGGILEARLIRSMASGMTQHIIDKQAELHHRQVAATQDAIKSVCDLAQECNRKLASHEQ